MRILSRYFAWRYLAMFAVVLAASTTIIIVVEMLLNLDDMLRLQPGLAGVLNYLLLRIPSYYLRELLPIASFAACFFTLGVSARWLEITALKSGGISLYRVVLPILVVAGLLGATSFVVGETWIVGSTREWNRIASGGGPDVHYQQGSFWYHRGRTIYSVSGSDPDTRTLRGVRIFERNRNGRLTRSIFSQKVSVEGEDRWIFEDAVIHHYAPDDPLRPVRIERVAGLPLDVGGPGDIDLIDMDLQSLGVVQLADYRRARKRAGDGIGRIETVLQARFAEPVCLVLFALLAAPLGFKVEEWRGYGLPALAGIVTVGLFFGLRSVTETLSSEGVISATIANGSLLIAFAALAVASLVRVRS